MTLREMLRHSFDVAVAVTSAVPDVFITGAPRPLPLGAGSFTIQSFDLLIPGDGPVRTSPTSEALLVRTTTTVFRASTSSYLRTAGDVRSELSVFTSNSGLVE